MAFNIRKKNKRLPVQDDTQEQTSEEQSQEQSAETNTGCPGYILVDPAADKSNVVATQSWVSRVLRHFLNWTRFFATESLQVAGGVHAGRVKTCEIQTNDIYATKLYLLDKEGKPCVLYVNDLGELKTDYDFKNVFVYPGNDGEVQFKKFVYRYGQSDDRVAGNFVGLTPYELLLNFVPFESNSVKQYNGKDCYRICSADGDDIRVDGTMLVTCPSTKKIVRLEVFDQDGETITQLYEIPSNVTCRRLTINMPCFKDVESGEKQHVGLPGDYPTIGSTSFQPFVPPFLLPPKPPFFVPPTRPSIPAATFHESLSNDIFDDQTITVSDDIFSDIDGSEDSEKPMQLTSTYEVLYENYIASTYVNIILKNSNFEKNVEQYVRVVTENSDN